MTENEARLILDVRISRFDHARDVNEALEIAKQALEEIQQYREIGTVEECREAVEKVQKADKAFNTILSGNYNNECSFCVHYDQCNSIGEYHLWCRKNAKWNGKESEEE